MGLSYLSSINHTFLRFCTDFFSIYFILHDIENDLKFAMRYVV